MPYLYLDNFELKLLKIWPMQEEHSDPLVCLPEKRKSVSHVEGALYASGGKRIPSDSQTQGTQGWKVGVYKHCYVFWPFQAQTVWDSSLTEHPKPVFLCPVIFSQMYYFLFFVFVLSKEKAPCSGHFLGTASIGPACAQIKICLFLLLESSHKNSRGVEGKSLPLTEGTKQPFLIS